MNHVKQHGMKKERSTWAANAYQEGGDVSFVRTLVYPVQTAAQSVAGASAGFVAAPRARADASATSSVGVGAGDIAGTRAGATGSAIATAGDGAPCGAGAGVATSAHVGARSSGRSD